MMVFRKKQKLPIRQAIAMVNGAIIIAYLYKRDKKYIPTKKDLKLFEALLESLWQNHCTLEYIIRCLRQRAAGKPEGSVKFTDSKNFDYHHPG